MRSVGVVRRICHRERPRKAVRQVVHARPPGPGGGAPDHLAPGGVAGTREARGGSGEMEKIRQHSDP